MLPAKCNRLVRSVRLAIVVGDDPDHFSFLFNRGDPSGSGGELSCPRLSVVGKLDDLDRCFSSSLSTLLSAASAAALSLPRFAAAVPRWTAIIVVVIAGAKSDDTQNTASGRSRAERAGAADTGAVAGMADLGPVDVISVGRQVDVGRAASGWFLVRRGGKAVT